ncbi:hypothetical protein BDB01DRAFT_848521 [Pilobolus umbonatus]|nr:hypothetical protein BDB01DRAFT_848521 [Pilobolus umbonatus]
MLEHTTTIPAFGCCCNKGDCSHLIAFNESYRRIESDALLAAEIGEALLSEKANDECYGHFKEIYQELKDLRWEKEESNGLIQSLQHEISLLKKTNKQIEDKMEQYKQEISKNKLCERLLTIRTDIEDELKTQISDLKQELTLVRKSETNLRSKYKRLNTNYETLQLSNDALKQEHDNLLKSLSADNNNNNNKMVNMKKVENTLQVYMSHVMPESIPNRTVKIDIPQFHVSTTNANKNPYDVLQSITKQTFDRICATDTRVLNRRLRRVFDMSELSSMSNSIIKGVLVDLDGFQNQFDWVYSLDDPYIEFFFPLLISIKELLMEISNMRMTLNDLQADYVTRIERLINIQQHEGSSIKMYQDHIRYRRELRHKREIQMDKQSTDKKQTFIQSLMTLFTIH